MSTVETPREQKVMVKEMSWDPITRIVGSLGIHTEIDFANQQVLKCYSTSMIFRGFDIFMRGIDPRDAHFITSRICGICGDNHCTCSCLNQNMAYGVKPPKLGDYAFNLAESADYMFDHAIFGELVTTDLVEINTMIRILLGSSYFEDWENEETFVTNDPLGNPIDKHHPWNKTTIPKPQKRDWTDKYSWVVSPRIYDKRTDTHVCCDTGGGPFARQWVTAKAGLVDIGYLKATGNSIQMALPRTATMSETELEWKVPEKSNAIERDRARSYHQAYSALVGLYNLEQALKEVRAGRTKSWNAFKVPDEAISVGFHEAARGVLSHHMVIRGGKIANYQPYPPTLWNASSRDVYGTPGPYEDAVQNTPIFEENGPDKFKGIDIMRAVRSFDPCLPCGVHMYLGQGKTLKKLHSPAVART